MNYSDLPPCIADECLGAIRTALAVEFGEVFPGGVVVLTRPRADGEPLRIERHRIEIVPTGYTPEGQVSNTNRSEMSLSVVSYWQDPAAMVTPAEDAEEGEIPATIMRFVSRVGRIIAGGSMTIRSMTYNAAPELEAPIIEPLGSGTVVVTIPVRVQLPREDLP